MPRSAQKIVAACALAGCSAAPEAAGPSPDAAIDAEPATPFVIRYTPNSDDTNVAPDALVRATFNKPVINISTFSFRLARRDTDTLVAAFVDYDAQTRTATLDPQATLEPSKTYVATLSAEIVDLQGAPLVGTTSWAFSIAPDTTLPSVIMKFPVPGAMNVAVDTAVDATFSEHVIRNSTMTFTLEGANGPVAATVVAVSPTGLRLTPAVQLAPQSVYTASLTSAISDLAGNPLQGAPIQWSFKTGADTVAPSVTSRYPDADDTDILLGTTVTVRFSEAVSGVSTASLTLDHAGTFVPASVTYLPGSRTARLAPAAALAPNTTYTVTATSAITDASGNALTPVAWDFETGSTP